MIDQEKPREPRKRTTEQAEPIPKPPIKLRTMITCSVCFKDFEWVGLASEIEKKKYCEGCQKW